MAVPSRVSNVGRAAQSLARGQGTEVTRLFLMTASTFLFAACSESGDPSAQAPSELSVRDSAGIETLVMANSRGATSADLGEPLTRTGWSDDGPAFQGLRHGRFLRDGSVLLTDPVSNWIYRFTEQLEVVDSIGGEGEGPGEFESIARVAAISADSLIVYDLTHDRITAFFDTTIVTRRMDPNRPAVFHAPSGVMPDGRIFWSAYGLRPQKLRSEGPLNAAVMVGDPWGDALDTIATVFFEDIVEIEGRFERRPMGPTAFTAPTPDGFVWSSNHQPEIRWFTSEGDLYRVLRWVEDVKVLDDQYWEDFVEAQVMAFTTETSVRLPENFVRDRYARSRPFLPETLPPFAESSVGTDGSIWLKRRPPIGTEESNYLVVSPDGRCMMNLAPPPRFTFMDSRDGLVLGRELDDLDVVSAVVYRRPTCPAP